jgi:hypothetical protein
VNTLRLVACFIGMAVLITLGSARAYAQFEVDPDHYENRDTEPLPQSRTNVPGQIAKVHYEGNFTLPYSVQCNRSSLPPGKYLITVDSEGRTARVTLNRRGHSVRIEGITQEQRPNQNHRGNVLVVERNGAAHQLSQIQVAEVDLVFSPALGFEGPADRKPRNLQELPLILADSRK